MKIQIMSDLHLEFDKDFRPEKTDADVLIIAGDICVAQYFMRGPDSPYQELVKEFIDFFRYCSDNYKQVFYIVGNHEYYHGFVENTVDILNTILDQFPNIVLLDDGFLDYKGVRFLGSTLWN